MVRRASRHRREASACDHMWQGGLQGGEVCFECEKCHAVVATHLDYNEGQPLLTLRVVSSGAAAVSKDDLRHLGGYVQDVFERL